jgi:hypothetical protein
MSNLGTPHLQGCRVFKHNYLSRHFPRVRRQKHSGKGNSTTALEALYSVLSLLPVLYLGMSINAFISFSVCHSRHTKAEQSILLQTLTCRCKRQRQ